MYYRDRETNASAAAAYNRAHKKLAADRLKAIAKAKKARKA